MRPTRVLALVIGCLILLPGIGLLFAGGALGIGYAAGRNDAGHYQTGLIDLQTRAAAITAETPTLSTDLQTPTWLINTLDTDLRLRVTAPTSDSQIFVGIGPAAQVERYLTGVAHDNITGLVNGRPVYRTNPGIGQVDSLPAGQTFWVAQTSGSGTQELSWHPANGQWAVVIMNADGSAGVTGAATVELQAGFLLPVAVTLLIIGVLLTAGATVLIIVGATGRRTDQRNQGWQPGAPDQGAATPDPPVALTAHLEPGLSLLIEPGRASSRSEGFPCLG